MKSPSLISCYNVLIHSILKDRQTIKKLYFFKLMIGRKPTFRGAASGIGFDMKSKRTPHATDSKVKGSFVIERQSSINRPIRPKKYDENTKYNNLYILFIFQMVTRRVPLPSVDCWVDCRGLECQSPESRWCCPKDQNHLDFCLTAIIWTKLNCRLDCLDFLFCIFSFCIVRPFKKSRLS